ncbi:DUF1450 domain-containing protein [Fodinisporobacter ferrooxydans]|uniref:DUF1450 domain-containing protein n=1 Tax=Fodinisporobacter ferrooxydans TaxID=2901836 RepID=UPI003D317B09
MIRKIEVCIGNFTVGTSSVLSQLQEMFPNIHFTQWSCLGNCHNCYHTPFVLINDTEIIEGATPDELLNKIIELIRESP